jgi:hypothetical protein
MRKKEADEKSAGKQYKGKIRKAIYAGIGLLAAAEAAAVINLGIENSRLRHENELLGFSISEFFEARGDSKDISGMERDPSKWKSLPLPKGAYLRGSGKESRVIINPNFLSVAMPEDMYIFLEFEQEGDFDLIAVQTPKGHMFYGKPGKIKVGLTKSEFGNYVGNNAVPLCIMGLDINYNKSGCSSFIECYKIKDMKFYFID